MNKGETVNAFFMRITELRDQSSFVSYEIDNQELSLKALGGLPNSWESFVQGISARSKIPKLDRLRFDCLQEESRLMTKGKYKTLMKTFMFLTPTLIRRVRRRTQRGKETFMERDSQNKRKTCLKFNVSDVINKDIMH